MRRSSVLLCFLIGVCFLFLAPCKASAAADSRTKTASLNKASVSSLNCLTGEAFDLVKAFHKLGYAHVRTDVDRPQTAFVNSRGVLKAKRAGKARVSVYGQKAGQEKEQKLAEYAVTVESPSLPAIHAVEGLGAIFDAAAMLTGTERKPNLWQSSDESVAIIDSKGHVQAVGYGLSTISARFGRGTSAELKVRVRMPYDGILAKHGPLGQGVGINPGRVVWVHDSTSVNWDGYGYWWETSHFSENAMDYMIDRGIAELTGSGSSSEGWERLFSFNNEKRGRSGGYKSGERVAIKCNMNGSGAYDGSTRGETKEGYTNPVLLKSFLKALVEDAQIPPQCITAYDAGRIFPDYMRDMCSQGNLSGVSFIYRDLGGENDAVPDQNAPVQWSGPVGGAQCFYPTCVTGADYIIDLANLKGHVYGITLSAKNHFGSFMNGNRHRVPQEAGMHSFIMNQKMGDYSPLVDLLASYTLGEKTVLYLFDAFICAPGESVDISPDNSRWKLPPFNGDYCKSLFLSQDPVALDSVGADFLTNEPVVYERNTSIQNNRGIENYLHEAAMVSAPPSGTRYTNGRGVPAANLGVHEHWNNSKDKLYSRNLGKDEGIELVYIGSAD